MLFSAAARPRHLDVANRLCKAATPLALVQETGREWTARSISKALRPANPWGKISRRLRDRKRDRGDEEAKFFFGNHERL